MSSSYRLYKTCVPDFLKNRPTEFVKHCMEKNDIAQDINPSFIVMQGDGKFAIQSCSRSSLEDEYHLFFGDDDTMPSCTCYNWKQSAYLCKHFFAVFKKFPLWSWQSLSHLYVNSLFLTLDETVVQHRLDVTEDKHKIMETTIKVSDPEAIPMVKAEEIKGNL